MYLLVWQKKLGSTVRPDTGSSPVRVYDVEVPKQYIVGRGVRNGCGAVERILMCIKQLWLI
jgi:hypothetical protein